MAKKKKDKKPEAPSYSPLELPKYEPVDYNATAQDMFDTQVAYADANIAKQSLAQHTLTRGAFNLSEELAPRAAQLRTNINAKYSPQIVDQYLGMIDMADPEFLAVRNKLGAQVSQGLDDGYEMGDELSREVEQSIRKGQSARGNWLGPAPAAAEAFGKASASIDLYNQRQGAAASFLSSRAPSDLFGQYAMMEAYQPVNVITPTGNYVDASLPAQVASASASNRNSYNNSLVSAYGANTSAQMASYDRQWDRYLYGQAVSNGLYSPVNTTGGGGGNGWMTGALGGAASGAMMGSAIGPWGTAIGAVVGGVAGGVMSA